MPETPESHDDPLKAVARTFQRLEELLDKLPLDIGSDLRARLRLLRALMLEKRPPALVLVGRRGAGKSSVVNALFGAKVAELGHVTAQTGRGRWFEYARDGGRMAVLDTRGLQEGSTPAEDDDAKTALESLTAQVRLRAPDLVVFVAKASEVDAATDGDVAGLERVYDELHRTHDMEPPLLVVVTHCDLLEPKSTPLHASSKASADDVAEKLAHVEQAERALAAKIDARPALQARHVATLGVSSYMSWRPDGSVRADDRWRIDDLALAIFRHLPDAGRAELARATQARKVQDELAVTLTKSTAAVCAGIAAAPLPVADIIPLTTLQAGLVASIAWIAGRSLDRRGATEFLTSVGANVGLAFVLRQAVRALLKIAVPVGGAVVSATIAFSGTMAIGTAARSYFVGGLSLRDVRKVFRRESGPS